MKMSLFAGMAISMTLAGCGGGSSGDSSESVVGDTTDGDSTGSIPARITNPTSELSGSFKYFAYFDLDSDDLLDRVNYEANFLELTEVQEASVFQNSVPPALDSCNLRITETIPTDATVIGFPEAQFTLVSAGETLTLTGDAGTYATIDRLASRFEIAPYPIPEPLTLDIPGDVFPAFSDLVVPSVIRLTDFASSGSSSMVNGDTTFTWTSSGDASQSVYIKTFEFPSSDRVVDLLCRMADDGEFNLPTDIVAALESALGSDFALTDVKPFTSAYTVTIQGNALIVVSKTNRSL